MVWDKGDWTPLGDVDQGLKDGHLKFELHGKKLKGDWVLVRMHGRAGGSDKTNWLLIKEKDKFARDSSDEPITEEAPNSAASGRTMEEIAARKGRVWNSTEGNAQRARKAAAGNGGEATAAAVRAQDRLAPNERRISARSTRAIPRIHLAAIGSANLISPKRRRLGPRTQAGRLSNPNSNQIRRRSGAKNRKVRLLTRKGLDWTARMPDIAAAAAKLSVKDAILDGEAVALDEHGVSNFADLQAAFQEGRQRYITYFAFDLLHLDGHNLRGLPLSERKQILSHLLDGAGGDSPLRFSEDLKADGE